MIEADLCGILAANPAFLPRLVMAWTVQHAVPLVSGGRLEQWQAALSAYPETLRHHLVRTELGRWATPHGWPCSLTGPASA
ncbi:hypothetical protein [Deinococcus carri]|uniref:hypothetical protein n=1 Tax=Deinococcus carri TaxID=1211323 RepID=UPI0031E52079